MPKDHVYNRTATRKNYKTSHAKYVANLPQTYHNHPTDVQLTSQDFDYWDRDINPEDEATIVTSADNVITLDG